MTAPFAAREARLTAAVFSHLSNAIALLDGESVPVIFDAAYQQVFDGISSSAPMAQAPSDLVAYVTTASVLVVNGSTYRVRSAQPDGTGITVLILEAQ